MSSAIRLSAVKVTLGQLSYIVKGELAWITCQRSLFGERRKMDPWCADRRPLSPFWIKDLQSGQIEGKRWQKPQEAHESNLIFERSCCFALLFHGDYDRLLQPRKENWECRNRGSLRVLLRRLTCFRNGNKATISVLFLRRFGTSLYRMDGPSDIGDFDSHVQVTASFDVGVVTTLHTITSAVKDRGGSKGWSKIF